MGTPTAPELRLDKELLARVNSATKYPSIPTYHALDPKNGSLLEDQPTIFDKWVIATEKLDGTNARIMVLNDCFIIGSRTELLTADGDLIQNPAEGIVDAVYDIASQLEYHRLAPGNDNFIVFYGEVYGGRATRAWKTYGDGTAGFRLFDIARIPYEVLDWPREQIAAWRDNYGQAFIEAGEFATLAITVPRVPVIKVFKPDELPQDLQGMRNLLGELAPMTRAAVNQGAADPMQRAEGVIFRTFDRSTIVKARFEDYDRTLRRLK